MKRPDAPSCGLSPARADETYRRLKKWLAAGKRFRRADCTVEAFAREAGLHRCYVSAAVRMGGGDSFGAMVSRLRVREACRLLRAACASGRSAEEIAIAAGFGSRQSFYNAFRKYMGRTPCQYRVEATKAAVTADKAAATVEKKN